MSKLMPIIFKPFSVRAILDEKKFRTTRIKDIHKMEPGDRFWVRETWAFQKNGINIMYKADFLRRKRHDSNTVFLQGILKSNMYNDNLAMQNIKWKSPLIMPKAACRLILHIKKKYKQELKDMTKKDAIVEGISEIETGKYPVFTSKNLDISTTLYVDDPVLSFSSMWGWINPGCKWDNNPEVFVFEFEKEVVR